MEPNKSTYKVGEDIESQCNTLRSENANLRKKLAEEGLETNKLFAENQVLRVRLDKVQKNLSLALFVKDLAMDEWAHAVEVAEDLDAKVQKLRKKLKKAQR